MNQVNNNSKAAQFAVNKELADTIISAKTIAVEQVVQKKQSVSLTIQLNTSPKPSRRKWRTYEFPLL